MEQTFRPALLTGRYLDQAAETFGRALVEALDHDPALAADLLERPGRRLPAEGYAAALGPARRAALHEVVGHGDRTVLTVIAEAAGRAGDLAPERAAGGRLAVLAGEQDTADGLVSLLRRRQDAGLLDLDTATQPYGRTPRGPRSPTTPPCSGCSGRLPWPCTASSRNRTALIRPGAGWCPPVSAPTASGSGPTRSPPTRSATGARRTRPCATTSRSAPRSGRTFRHGS
ncbi:hypothetical protein [Streptomyces sp. NPDC085540]|uniref:hypothetical protein n=1 Tax=Streptomyces sp. NPDC085540 TaxID=3365730 RepID=UPI0037CF558C